MQYCYCFPTLIGYITLSADDTVLTRLDFKQSANNNPSPLLLAAAEQIEDYLAGKRQNFSLPFKLTGTDFQKKVWACLQQIPYGQTISYKKLAEMAGNPKACRAVGGANNKNPLPIIVPCHRVIGTNGQLVGYGGGLHIKRSLLSLEQKKQ